MGIIIRQSAKASIATYIGIIIGYINITLMFPYFLSPEQYGLTRVLTDAAFLGSQVAQLGIYNITNRFFPYFATNDKKNHGFLVFAAMYLAVGFAIFLLIFFALKSTIISGYSTQSPLFVEYYWLVVPFAFFLLLSRFFESYGVSLYRIMFTTFIREVGLRIFVSILLFLYFFQILNFEVFIWSYVGMYAFSLLFLFLYFKQMGQLHFQSDFPFLRKKFVKIMTYYGSITLLTGISAVLVDKIDTLMISYYLGLDNTAFYSVAFFIAVVIQIPYRAIGSMSVPVIAEAWKNRDMLKLQSNYSQSSINLLIVGGLLFCGIWANEHNIFRILPPEYAQGKWVLFFVALGKLIGMGSGTNSEIINNSKSYIFNLILFGILAILLIGSNMILIPKLGIVGAAIGTTLSVSIFTLSKVLFLWIKYRLQPFTKNTVLVLIFGGASLLFASFIPKMDSLVLDLMIRSLVVAIVFCTPIYFLKISGEINETIRLQWNKLMGKIGR